MILLKEYLNSNIMNIVLASDNNFVQHCAVTIVSILQNNDNVNIYLLTDNLNDENQIILSSLTQDLGGQLTIIKVPENLLDKLPMPKGLFAHISIATYYRLFMAELLPNEVKKVIYMDCDVIVRRSLKVLWETNLTGYAIGAIYQYNEWSDKEQSWQRLNIKRDFGYFNAGVLLVNLQYWRDNDIQKMFMRFIKNNYKSIRSHDQDVLNAVLTQKTLPLRYTWNLLPWLFDDFSIWSFPYRDLLESIDDDIENPHIVHFVNIPKPWKCGCLNPFRKEYYKYLQLTPWKSYKPKFEFVPWWENRLYHPLMVWLGKIKRNLFK